MSLEITLNSAGHSENLDFFHPCLFKVLKPPGSPEVGDLLFGAPHTNTNFYIWLNRCKTDAAKVKIISCNQLQGKLAKAGKLLQSKGFTKCVQPFGVLVVGKSTFKDSGILATAKIVAELIDQNRDGN